MVELDKGDQLHSRFKGIFQKESKSCENEECRGRGQPTRHIDMKKTWKSASSSLAKGSRGPTTIRKSRQEEAEPNDEGMNVPRRRGDL